MLAEPHPQPQSPSRRGACPTLRAPMQTGDGLLARLRPVGGTVSPAQLQAIAALANRHGNGQIEITARGNLQVRGLQAASVPAFAAAIEALLRIETGVPIETAPLSGLDPAEIADARPIAIALRRAIAATALQAALGPKVTVLIDGGGNNGLNALTADISLRAIQPALWQLAIAGRPIGCVLTTNAADAITALLTMIAALGTHARGRDLAPAAVRQKLAPNLVDQFLPAPPPPRAPDLLRDGRTATPIALPFGAASASTLNALAQAAGATEFRVAPQHQLIALCASPAAAKQLQHAATGLGFLTNPADPRRAISACIGSDGCASGLLPARRLAETLSQTEPAFFDGSFTLHVSGCAKGCVHPGPALLTLVGGAPGIALIVDGSAKDASALNLPSDTAPAAIHRLAVLWRDERALGESVASCFKRLGSARVAAAVMQGQK